MFRKTIRTAALLIAAAVTMTMISQESSAQCKSSFGGSGFNRGFSGVSVNVGRSGFGGFNNGFGGSSFGFNSFSRPSFNSGFRGGSFSGKGFSHGGINSFNSFGRSGFRY